MITSDSGLLFSATLCMAHIAVLRIEHNK